MSSCDEMKVLLILSLGETLSWRMGTKSTIVELSRVAGVAMIKKSD